MKHLGTFACDKVITDFRGAPSVITIMQNAHIAAYPDAPPQEIPANAVIPKEWFIFSAWSPTPADVGQRQIQITQVFWPNGEKITEARTDFEVKDDWQYNTVQIGGFPAGQKGNVMIRVWLADRNEKKLSDVIEFFIRVKHDPAPTSPAPPPIMQVSR